MVFNSISNFLATKEPFKKNDMQQKPFVKDLGHFNIKNHLPLQFVESILLKQINMHLCPRIVFPFRKQFSHNYCLI
jgi:hypothetical protein